MSDWIKGTLADTIGSLDSGVSVNAEDRPHGAGEIGVLKTSAVSAGVFRDEENKAVLVREKGLVTEPVLADSVLVSRMNTPALVGESCYVGEAHPTLFLPDRLWQLKPRARAELSMRWLSFVLQSTAYRRYVAVNATGTSGSMKNLPKANLLALPVAYPTLDEQRAISKVLDTLDSAIRETTAAITKSAALKQGLLHDLLTRGVDSNGELRPPPCEAPQLYKQSTLGLIPREYELVVLADCAEVTGGVTLGRAPPGTDLIEVSYLRVANVQDGFVDLTDVKTIKIHSSEMERFSLRDGDVLMNEGGDFDKLGRGTVWRSQISPCLHQNHVFRVRCDQQLLSPSYLAAFSASPRGKAYFVKASKQTTNLASINSTQLKAFPLSRPPIEEQHTVIRGLDALEFRLTSERSLLSKLRALKSGLTDDLLSGDVRIPRLTDLS
jgi:type I restriction enzyme S subunit